MNTDAPPFEVLPTADQPQPQPLALRIDDGLEPATAQSLRDAFEDYFKQADEWRTKALAIQITRPDQVREMKLARTTRLALREIRINAEKARKRLKEDSLRKGKAIDGIYNMLEFAVAPLEKHLLEQEQFVERMEEERKAKLKAEREEKLAPFGVDVSLYQLGEMDDATFAQLLETNQLAFAARQEAARKAEAERIERERIEADERAKREAEAAAERERLRAENERLEREKAEAAAKLAAEREAAEKASREAEEKARKEREAAEAQARAEREAREKVEAELRAREEAERKARREAEEKARQEREAAEAQARAEREAREKAEAELRAREEAERKAREEAEAKARAAAQAPDREKLAAFAEAVRNLPIPTLDSEAGKAITNLIRDQVTKFAAWIINQQTKLN